MQKFAHKGARRAAAALLAGCLCLGGLGACAQQPSAKSEALTLRLCADQIYKSTLRDVVAYWKAHVQKQGAQKVDIALEFLPEESSERKSSLKRMRTELMAGKGADIFLLASPIVMQAEEPSSLFPDPKKSMRNGVFADLRAYTKDDKAFQACEPSVMAAGMLDGKQYLLPLAYSWAVAAYDKQKLAASGIQEADLRQNSSDLLGTISQVKDIRQTSVPLVRDAFPNAVSYADGKPTYSKAQLLKYLQKFDAYRTIWVGRRNDTLQGEGDHVPEFLTADNYMKSDFANWKEKGDGLAPMLTEKGETAAMVTDYAAVRRNCADVAAAYAFLRFLISDTMQSHTHGTIFDEADNVVPYLPLAGVPVNREAREEAVMRATQVYRPEGEAPPQEAQLVKKLLATGDKPAVVDFPTDWEWKIERLLFDSYTDLRKKDPELPGKMADQIYREWEAAADE